MLRIDTDGLSRSLPEVIKLFNAARRVLEQKTPIPDKGSAYVDNVSLKGLADALEPFYSLGFESGRICITEGCNNPVPWNQGSDYCADCIMEDQ